MPNTPFLLQVAKFYADTENLKDYCFVFPNRRSGRFFEKYLETSVAKVTVMPTTITITDFLSDITGEVTANPIESLFILYKAYCSLLPEGDEYEFDKFIYWGNIILNDFNDIDMSQVDAMDIFTNLKDSREIATDYLTDDLKELLSKYFNMEFGKPINKDTETTDDAPFWKCIASPQGEGNDVKKNFFKLWQILYKLYDKFNDEMKARGLSYKGKIYRDTVEKLKSTAADALPYQRYVFIGFNVLCNCDQDIFRSLNNKGIADFFWDDQSKFFEEENNIGTKFIREYKKQFPTRDDFNPEPVEDYPQNINVIGVPSNIGQVKYALNLVDQLIDNGTIAKPDNAIDTAIVLPDEGLLLPLINSVSDKVGKLNITMGYQLRDSDIVSLMRLVAKMHKQASEKVIEGKQCWCFYREDVKDILSHPIIKSIAMGDALTILEKIDKGNIYYVPEDEFKDTKFKNLFIAASDQNKTDIEGYIDNLIAFSSLLTDDTKDKENLSLQDAFVEQYIDVLYQIKDAIDRYDIAVHNTSVFYLIDRLTSSFSIPFQGEPLEGMQIMGMLETRGLDFDNIIILSTNERVLPRKHFSSSFISDFLRYGFNMSTLEDQESMATYYFYRLIGRASNVYLIYDSSTQTISSGEPSRFISQLDKVYGCNIHYTQVNTQIHPTQDIAIKVPKDERINVYKKESGEDKKELSASSINKYINCPLRFYLHYIEGLNDENDKTDFMDSATFGTIIHDTLQELYSSAPKNKVTKDVLNGFKKKTDSLIKQNINKIYLHLKDDELNTKLKGETAILFDTIKQFVVNALDYDLNLLKNEGDYLKISECEKSHTVRLKINDITVNFSYKPDRIDQLNGNGPLRIIDYKTGKDETAFKEMKDLFTNNSKDNRRHAILQLLLYCNAYHQENPEMNEIQPVIYKLKEIEDTGVFYNGSKENLVINFNDGGTDVNKNFLDTMATTFNEMFSLESKYEQTKFVETQCKYCKFTDFCRRKS
jgi:hypothetical protein